MNFLRFLLAAALVATVSADAQNKRTVKLRAICFQHVDDITKLHAIGGGENPSAVEFDLYTSSFSDEFEVVVTDGVVRFATPEGNPDGKPGFKIVAAARVGAGPRHLAIFIPGKPGGSPYRCLVVDDSEKVFPMGSTRVINLAATAFRFAIGEHAREVKPGGIETIPMARKTNDLGQVMVLISVADPDADGGWRGVNQTRWFSGTDKRDLAIAFIHPQTLQPTVQCYADNPPWIIR